MKKLLAVILAIVMMFSMTSVSFANETSAVDEPTNTIDNYVDYLEEKLNDTETNIFVKLLVKIVLVFIHFGFIKPDDFEDWFENTVPETEENSTEEKNDSDTPDWEDGTELTLYHTQSLPYAKNGITITDIKITKEHYNGLRNDIPQMYKYVLEAEGFIDNYNSEYPPYYEIDITYLSEFSHKTRCYVMWEKSERNVESTITIDESGNFVYHCEQYMFYNDYDSFFIYNLVPAALPPL